VTSSPLREGNSLATRIVAEARAFTRPIGQELALLLSTASILATDCAGPHLRRPTTGTPGIALSQPSHAPFVSGYCGSPRSQRIHLHRATPGPASSPSQT
jgi:hypothetical protein